MNRKCIFTTDKLPITCNGYGDFVQKCKREKRLRAGLVLLLRYVATRQGNNFTIAATHSPCDSNSPKYVGGVRANISQSSNSVRKQFRNSLKRD